MFSPGDTVGPYVIEARLGAGGFGEVYRAREQSPNRLVALKVVLPKFADHPLFLRRFEHEVNLIAKVEHPNVVPIYRHGDEGGHHYFAMRFMAGGTLSDLLADDHRLADVLKVLDGSAAGLDACHAEGVVHRDVKPDNILIDMATGEGLLSDFGIAYSDELSTLTGPGERLLTLAYAAPEVLLGSRATGDSDLWSFAAVAYRVLAGTHPRGHGVDPTTKIVPPSFHQPDLGPGVDRAILRALEFKPANRHRSASAFMDELREAVSRPQTTASTQRTQPQPPRQRYDRTAATIRVAAEHEPSFPMRRIAIVAATLFALTPALAYALTSLIN